MYSISGISFDGGTLTQEASLAVFSEVLVTSNALLHTNFDTMDGGRTFSLAQQAKDRNQAQRFMAAREGRVVLHKTQHEEAHYLLEYYIRRGLASSNVRQQPLFVEAPLHDTEAVFDEVGKLHDRAVIEPYFACPSLVELARSKGVKLKHAPATSLELVERLNDKGYFVRSLDSWFTRTHGEPFLPYPVAHVDPTESGSLEEEVEACCRYARSYTRPLKYLAIVQETSLSGGLGNYFLDHDFVLHQPEGEAIPLTTVQGLVRWLRREKRAFRVAPFLDIVESYSFSLAITRKGCAWDGPRYQLVDETGAWIGCRLKAQDDWSFEREVEVCRFIGTLLHEANYTGTVAIDFFRFRSPDGRERVSAFELNGRFNGNAGALGTLLRYPSWTQRVVSRQLSLEYYASCPLPMDCDSIDTATSWLLRRGVEMSSSTSPDGVTFITHPVIGSKKGYFCGLLNIASTDEKRDEVAARIMEG